MSVISDTLSTSEVLLLNQQFQSPATDLEGFNQISITCNFNSVSSNTLNLVVEFSSDSVNYDHTETFQVTNNNTFFDNIQVKSRYCRITLQNNDIAMLSLRLETICHTSPNTLNVVVDGTSTITIANGTNNNRINGILNNGQIIANTYSDTIDLKASGDEMYNNITVSGKSPELYNMVLEYSNDNSTFFTDHIEPEVVQKGNNTHYEWSLTRNSINHRYVRVYHLLGSSSLDLIYSITRN
jgi:hypothetical protein